MFGQPGQPGAAPRRFRATGGELRAGIVRGLGRGVLMALVADAAAPEGAIIGLGRSSARSRCGRS
ncbi:hypothetical protein [Albidovulum sp.]|uniref:hypothetical protein n=1 Tax=Albidovulum sp. TaxID=1872424 RepID=UPI0039B92D60